MATVYSEIPHNWSDIQNYVITDKEEIVGIVIRAKKILFYDTCSFRYHSNLNETNRNQLISYYLKNDMAVIVTRTILMELASFSGNLETCYIEYFKVLQASGVSVIVLDEEVIYDILAVCFSTNEAINSYLLWAVRTLNAPVSTITATLASDDALNDEVKKGKNQNSSEIYSRFFKAIRNNKESGDNLGEEILAICLHILSHLPGTKDGKLCVITEDKGGAGKINSLLLSTNRQHKGAKIIIYSTPKMIQSMLYDGIAMGKKDLESFFRIENASNISIIGTTEYDFCVEGSMSLSKTELIDMILVSGRINILF